MQESLEKRRSSCTTLLYLRGCKVKWRGQFIGYKCLVGYLGQLTHRFSQDFDLQIKTKLFKQRYTYKIPAVHIKRF